MEFRKEKEQVKLIHGPVFDCYGEPWEGCLNSPRFKAYMEPCMTCINKYGKHLLERVN